MVAIELKDGAACQTVDDNVRVPDLRHRLSIMRIARAFTTKSGKIGQMKPR